MADMFCMGDVSAPEVEKAGVVGSLEDIMADDDKTTTSSCCRVKSIGV
jgi:hypothetical protein